MADASRTNGILAQLRQFAPEAVRDTKVFRGELTLSVAKQELVRVAQFLRDADGLRFNYLADVTALDHYPDEPRYEVVYHLLSLATAERLRLKVAVPEADPRVDSVVPVWPSANAFEREVFDMFGIRFEGHPYMRRILMPEDWEGHPLRKDYPTEGNR